MHAFLRLLLLVVLGTVLPVHAGPGVWTSAGPEGGSLSNIAVDPAQPNTVFLSSSSSVYRSTDAGLNWTKLNIAPYVSSIGRLAMSPHDGDILLANAYSRVFRSLDGGDNWAPLSGGLPAVAVFRDLVFDPTTPGRIWLAGTGEMWRSDDNGTSWTALAATGFIPYPNHLVADPHVAGRLLVSGSGAIARSTDAGVTWTAVTGLPLANNNETLTFTAVPGQVLVDQYSEIYRSTDGGATFSPLGPVTLPRVGAVRRIKAHPTNADVWWLLTSIGLARTDDGGATYSVIGQGIRPVAGGAWDNGVNAVFIRPDALDTIYAAADFTGFYVTTNGGASWSRRNNGLREAQIRSLAVHPAQPLWVYAGYGDAFDTPSDGLFRSIDRGASWFSASPTLEASGLRTIFLDPQTTASPFTTTLYAAGYAQPIMSMSGAVRDGNAGVFKSTDGGATWSTIDNGIPYTDAGGYRRSYFVIARSIVADPSSGGAPAGTGPLQTLYLGGSGTIHYDGVTGAPTVRAARIYKSTDAGATWSPSDNGLPIPLFDPANPQYEAVQVVPIVVDPVTPTTLYVGTTTNSYDPASGPGPLVSRGIINGVFKSTDGGANWVHSSNGLPRMNPADPDSSTRTVLALALAPSQPSRLYASTSNLLFDSIVYRSDDAGASWYEANTGIAPDADIRALIVDPNNPDIAYAGSTGSETNPGGVYRTLDGGVTWTSYSVGLPSSAATALALDLSGAIPRLYAGTRHGVFSIDQVPDEDLDGVPTAIESGAPNGGDGNGDGIPDTVQAGVASLVEMGDGVRSGGGSYVSIEVEPINGACAQLENAHALPASAFPLDPGFELPLGLVRLDLGSCTQARMHLRYHGGSFDPSWRFRVYAPLTPDQSHTYAWRDLPFTRDGQTWTVTLTDNELGDLRASDNAILFQGGVAWSETLFANGFESP